jgi:type III pantothenate kinase
MQRETASLPPILEVDIGNTWVKWRLIRHSGQVLFRDRQLTATLVAGWQGAQAFASLPSLERPEWARGACVAGAALEACFAKALQASLGLPVRWARVQPACAGVVPAYTDMTRLGVDRWLATLAAFVRSDGAAVVLSAGSAWTVDWVDASGRHLGGWIAPGLERLLGSVFNDLASVLTQPLAAVEPIALPAPGRSSEQCVLQGVGALCHGWVQQVAAQPASIDATWWLTGGNAPWLAAALTGRGYRSEAELVLDGLAYALPTGEKGGFE